MHDRMIQRAPTEKNYPTVSALAEPPPARAKATVSGGNEAFWRSNPYLQNEFFSGFQSYFSINIISLPASPQSARSSDRHMNIEHLKTYLEIAATGSFHKAASQLNVTQSTVSARVKALEDRLDRPLFARNRFGAELTPAGHQFHRFAENAVRAWEQGRREVALPEGYRTSFGVGAQASLWDRLLVRWVPWMRQQAPDVALRLNSDFSDPVSRQVLDGALDLGVVYYTRIAPGLVSEVLLQERLILVSTISRASLSNALGESFLNVDWGEEFAAELSRDFPSMASPSVSFDLGLVALQYLLATRGSGYFPLRTVREHLRAKRLYRVRGAPIYRRPAYAIHPGAPRDPVLTELALRGLRSVARRVNRAD